MDLVRPVLGPFAVVTATCALVAALTGGADAVLGVLAGGVLVALFLGSSPVLMDPVARRSPVLSLPVALTFFAAKAISAALLLLVFLNVGGMAEAVDRRALGLTVVVLSLVWSALQVRAYRRRRIPAYDLGTSE